MEEGSKAKRTVFVGGVGDEVDEAALMAAFSTFGDIIEVQLPTTLTNPSQQASTKHRGFAFVTFSSPEDAQDAIDNMDLNELKGKVLKVNLARHTKAPVQGLGNRAVWESEEWLQEHVKPLSESGGAKIAGRQARPEDDDGDTMEE